MYKNRGMYDRCVQAFFLIFRSPSTARRFEIRVHPSLIPKGSNRKLLKHFKLFQGIFSHLTILILK